MDGTVGKKWVKICHKKIIGKLRYALLSSHFGRIAPL